MTQKACIYLKTSEDGKRLMTESLKTPGIMELYENKTVYLTPFLKQSDRLEFQKIKEAQYHHGKRLLAV